jgi:molybdate transport system ATP-binding protein
MGVIFEDVAVSRGEFTLEASFASDARWLALFGRSGSGKTTLLDALAGLVAPSRGRIEAGGRLLFDARRDVSLPPRRRAVGYVRQTSDLFPKMTVEENVRFGEPRAGRPSAEELLAAFGLEKLRRRLPGQLSGGEARRVQIARAAASGPAILLLDEPLANLDEASRREIVAVFSAMKERFSVPAILVSHRFDEVLAFADEVVVLEEGRVRARGEPFATLSRPAAWPVAKIAGIENVLRCVVGRPEDGEGGTQVEWQGLSWHAPRLAGSPGDPVSLGLFAEDVILARGLSGRVSARNRFEARVERVSESGGEALVELAAGGGRLVARVTRGALTELEIIPGAEVTVLVKSAALRILT